MKKLTTGVLLALVLACTNIITSCQSSDSTWSDVPAYPNATQESIRTWVVLPTEGVDWSGVEWKYYSSDDNWQTVDTFFSTELPKKGWQYQAEAVPDNILQIESNYLTKFSYYVDVTTLENWSAFSKNNGNDWVIVWVGLKVTEPLPGKAYITFNGQSHNTFFIVMRSQQQPVYHANTTT